MRDKTDWLWNPGEGWHLPEMATAGALFLVGLPLALGVAAGSMFAFGLLCILAFGAGEIVCRVRKKR